MQDHFPLNIHNLRVIYQAVSSYRPQVTHSEQIIAAIGNGQFLEEESALSAIRVGSIRAGAKAAARPAP
jgi:hypothetical protein